MTEVVEIAFDEVLVPETFSVDPAANMAVSSSAEPYGQPRAVEDAAKRAPFTVLIPQELPREWRAEARYFADVHAGPAVSIAYWLADAPYGFELFEQSATGRDEDEEYVVWEPREYRGTTLEVAGGESIEGERYEVRTEREATGCVLASSPLMLEDLLEVAATLSPAEA